MYVDRLGLRAYPLRTLLRMEICIWDRAESARQVQSPIPYFHQSNYIPVRTYTCVWESIVGL